MNETFDPSTITPPDSPMTLADVMSSAAMRDLSTPKLGEGDPAADFTLATMDLPGGERPATPRAVALSQFRGKRPVALIFGSYT